ncbi:MAG: FAD-binding oxidoreductase [Pseudomonadota bacterium]
MNLLTANDRDGQYPDSWYAATATPLAPFAPLKGVVRADVCVVGGGYTGLSAALHLAQMDRDVVLIDAQRVGFGASGRNGGQLGSGQRVDQIELERLLGTAHAAQLWEMAEATKSLVKALIKKHEIDCYLRPGVLHAASNARSLREELAYAEHLERVYGYTELETLDKDALQSVCRSPDYLGGVLDRGAAHLHPLRYALGLARAADQAGVRIFEGTMAQQIEERPEKVAVRTDAGAIEAQHVILACNGYLGALNDQVAGHVMPINNFIAATEPLGDRVADVLPRDVAVADDRFVVNYFRLSHDGRLLFGGGESYGYRFPRDIGAVVRKPLSRVFPQLKDIPFDYTWGGTLAITLRRLPYLARPGQRILSASGYSGHGVGNATHAGLLMAQAVAGDAEGFDTMSAIPARRFPGGAALRSPLLVLAMTWYSLRDRLGL